MGTERFYAIFTHLSCHRTGENIASFDLYGLKLCHAFVSDSLCSRQLPGSVLFFSSTQEAYSPVVLANMMMAACIQGCAPHQLLDVFKVVFWNISLARECMRVSPSIPPLFCSLSYVLPLTCIVLTTAGCVSSIVHIWLLIKSQFN